MRSLIWHRVPVPRLHRLTGGAELDAHPLLLCKLYTAYLHFTCNVTFSGSACLQSFAQSSWPYGIHFTPPVSRVCCNSLS